MELTNRLKKQAKQLGKWAKKNKLTCYRLYDKDLPNYPFILDWYQGDACLWFYARKIDDTPEKEDAFKEAVIHSVLEALEIHRDRLHIKSRQKQKGLTNQYKKVDHSQQIKIVQEGGLKFEVNMSDYLDTGLFLDHRNTRDLCRSLAKGKTFLNLFAYTGAFTCYAIDGGATETTSVDLNNNYSKWSQRNVLLNRKNRGDKDQFIVDNVLSFIKVEAKRKYDLIVCDPATFSNSKKMKTTFSINDDYVDLIKSCIKLLSPKGTLIFSTNSKKFQLDTTRFSNQISFKNITHQSIPFDYRNKQIHQCWLITKE